MNVVHEGATILNQARKNCDPTPDLILYGNNTIHEYIVFLERIFETSHNHDITEEEWHAGVDGYRILAEDAKLVVRGRGFQGE